MKKQKTVLILLLACLLLVSLAACGDSGNTPSEPGDFQVTEPQNTEPTVHNPTDTPKDDPAYITYTVKNEKAI